MQNNDLTFRWEETGTSVNQRYSLWFDRDINFSSAAAKKYDVDGKEHLLSRCEMEKLLKGFGVPGGKSLTVYWTVVHRNQTPAQATSIYSFNTQRISYDIFLQLPNNNALVNLQEESKLTFVWDEKGATADQTYFLWFDKDDNFSSTAAKKIDTIDKTHSFSWNEFDNLMEDFGVAQGEEGTIYWTVTRNDLNPGIDCNSQLRILKVQRVSESSDGYQPVTLYDYTGPTFYVDSENGNDSNAGTSEASAWKTLEKVNSYHFTAGNIIRFKCGGLWRGQLKPKSGVSNNPIVYTSYGTGKKPILQLSVARDNAGDWQEVASGIWETNTDNDLDIGNIIFNHGEACGVKKPSRDALSRNGDYFSDRAHAKLYLKLAQNPATLYRSIELAPKMHGVDLVTPAVRCVTFDGLAVRYAGAHGFALCNSSNVVIRRCDISWIGGSYQKDPPNPIRYGNAIEFWIGASNMLVENNRIWEIYDAGVTNQGSGSINTQQNITYRNNLIWNCEMSFEYWNSPANSVTRDILFENNTCVNAGYGWGHEQRPDKNGTHLNFYKTDAKVSGFIIRNNVFVDAKNGSFRMDNHWPTDPYCNYNLYYTTLGGYVGFVFYTHYTTLEALQSATGFDSHSIFVPPGFVNPEKHDYRLVPERKMANGIMPGILQWDQEWNQE